MRKSIFYIIAFSLLFTKGFSQTYLISHELLATYTEQEAFDYLNNQGVPAPLIPITNSLKAYKIIYNTVSWDSSATIASGVVFFPDGLTCKSPIMTYNHGTIMKRSQAPSSMTGEYLIGVAIGADGMVVAMPDYLGLGESPGIHPYHHAQSEATCVIDMLRATRELASLLSVGVNDQIFLTGYSQGGHVTMATHKFIQEHLSDEFKIAASAPLSGAYQLSGVQAEVITRDSSYGAPGYLPFIINSFNTVYNLYPSYSDIYKSPYDTIIPPYFDGNFSIGQLENVIPDTPKAILQPAILLDFETNPNNAFRQTLIANDLYNWTPIAPTRMYYCEADHLVTYLNALEAKNAMHANGATHVEAVSANPAANHQGCALYALLQTKFYFEQFRQDRYTIDLTIEHTTDASTNDGSIEAIPSGGYEPYSYAWSNSSFTSVINNLAPGIYTVTITDANGCTSTALGSVGVTSTEQLTANSLASVFPNPTRDMVQVELYKPINQGFYVLTNIEGDIIKYIPISENTSNISLSLNEYRSGVYLLHIYADFMHSCHRIIKE